MPRVQRIGDPNTAGGVIIDGVGSVRINGRPVAVVVAHVSPHPCCGRKGCGKHCHATVNRGSSSVRAGGRAIIYNGIVDSCGHVRTVGSPNVNVAP